MFFRPDVCEGFRHTISPLLWRKHEDGDPGVSSGVISRSMQRLAVELLDRAIMIGRLPARSTHRAWRGGAA
jgi:hypothetical protein